MTSTPIWVPIVVAGIGVVGVILSALLTQWRANVREDKRVADEERREERRLAHAAEREREARLFDHRRHVFASVVEQYTGWSAFAFKVENGQDGEPPEDAWSDFDRVVEEVDLYCGEEVAACAVQLRYAVRRWVSRAASGEEPGEDEDDSLEALYRYWDFLAAARAELGVPARDREAGPPFTAAQRRRHLEARWPQDPDP